MLRQERPFCQTDLLFMEMLSSQPGRFARFAAALPVAVPPARQNKTIFLVHSSCKPFSPVKAALQERGYQVIFAESVAAALRIWEKLATRVDLFLADISLGRDHSVEQLVKLLQAENPRLRVLYANDLEQAAVPMAAPVYPQQLVAVVDNCLG